MTVRSQPRLERAWWSEEGVDGACASNAHRRGGGRGVRRGRTAAWRVAGGHDGVGGLVAGAATSAALQILTMVLLRSKNVHAGPDSAAAVSDPPSGSSKSVTASSFWIWMSVSRSRHVSSSWQASSRSASSPRSRLDILEACSDLRLPVHLQHNSRSLWQRRREVYALECWGGVCGCALARVGFDPELPACVSPPCQRH